MAIGARSGISLYQCDISNTVNTYDKTQIQSITLTWIFFFWKPYAGHLHGTVKVTPSHWEPPLQQHEDVVMSLVRACITQPSRISIEHAVRATWRKYYAKPDSKAGTAIHLAKLQEEGGGVTSGLELVCLIPSVEIRKNACGSSNEKRCSEFKSDLASFCFQNYLFENHKITIKDSFNR